MPKSPAKSQPATKPQPLRQRIIETRMVSGAELKRNPANFRTHPEDQRRDVTRLLEEVGQVSSLMARIDTDGSVLLLDGHLRADIADDRLVRVDITDLTEQEGRLVLAMYDYTTGMAGVDLSKAQTLVASLLSERPDWKAPLAGMGRAMQTLAKLHPQTIALPDDVDRAPEPPDNPITQPGDLWILGEHRLLCGDSSKPADVDRLIDGQPIHLVNTDPPYNVKVESRSNNAIAAGLSSFQGTTHHQGLGLARHPEKSKPTQKKLRAKDRPLANDFVSEAEFDRLLDAWFGNIARVLKPGRSFYIWGGYATSANYPPFLKKHGLYFSQAIIWVKQHPVLTHKDFMGNYEWCFYGWLEGAAHQFHGPTNATDVWFVKKVHPQSMVHLTEKPVELAVQAMMYSSLPGENVLDLFGGSGSTLIGAQQSGRRAFLMEMDQAYCDLIVTRFEQFTGTKATRIPG